VVSSIDLESSMFCLKINQRREDWCLDMPSSMLSSIAMAWFARSRGFCEN
jgi:hypothetical protein